MPPRTRTRATKALKENVDVVKKSKLKSNGKVSKTPRKALADKTNSLSDDNASIDIPTKPLKTVAKNTISEAKGLPAVRPRRDRRIPTRYVENEVLNNLSNSKDVSGASLQNVSNKNIVSKSPDKSSKTKATMSTDMPKSSDKTLKKLTVATDRPKRNCRIQSTKEKHKQDTSNTSSNASPFKTPSKSLETSLISNRPKRISRLPSRLEEHSISPNKFIPVQPCHASTPISRKNDKNTKEKTATVSKQNVNSITNYFKNAEKEKTNLKSASNKNSNKKSPDTNNNAKTKTVETRKGKLVSKLASKQVSPNLNKKSPENKRLLNKSLSFRVLEDKKTDENRDVYEFTYDPNEEPRPQKKKRKRTVTKKPPKPKPVVLKSNYDYNVSKAMEALKSKVKPGQTVNKNVENKVNNTQDTNKVKENNTQITNKQNQEPLKPTSQIPNTSYVPTLPHTSQLPNISGAPLTPINESAKNSIYESNYKSICIEDIAADFESTVDNNDINYSPVNSPCHQNDSHNEPVPSVPEAVINNVNVSQVNEKDPLNLQGDVSFFDENPVASSSMNVSIRHPTASPWRVEFGSLPIKWQANTYVKPNMTPAVECSFVNTEDSSKKKHVYIDMVPQGNDSLPEIVDNNNSNLVQKSIISFFKEVVERKANKKKRGRSVSPTKANSLFEDISSTSFGYQTPKKAKKSLVEALNTSDNSNNKSNENKSIENDSDINQEKENSKEKDKDCTYFGFDESEADQENVSPIKKAHRDRMRGLRSHSRGALQELKNRGPTRPVLPVAAKKLASSEVVNKLYEQLKSAEDAPIFPEKETRKDVEAENAETTNVEEMNEDSESVHLFEDIEFVHHLKQHRKSYGKAKKVTFQKTYSNSDSEQSEVPEPARSDDEDDLADLSFHVPDVKEKKARKKKNTKKQMTRKEEKEVEEWAAGFNSMCEDIDDFDLVVE